MYEIIAAQGLHTNLNYDSYKDRWRSLEKSDIRRNSSSLSIIKLGKPAN